MTGLLKARIIGTGSYLPERVLSNKDLSQMVDTSDEWIVSRTGMKERRLARKDEFTSDMGYEAALKALEAARVSPEEIDLILFATLTPDYLFPSTACLIQSRLKAVNAGALDIQAACTGYVYGLSIAQAYIESGRYRTILVVASEKLSSIVDYTDRTTCVLFGDGASACVVTNKGSGLLVRDVCIGADGDLAELLILPAGGSRNPASMETISNKMHYLRMGGKETYKHAVRRMEMASNQCLARVGIPESEISWIVPHQANVRIIEGIAKRFGVSMDRVYLTIEKYGNTSASSLGIALDELLRAQLLKEGNNVLLVAFGAGLTWGASIVTYIKEDPS
jgi:3-oxoacyl-[acyl-carrier-protein] synthase-3